MSVEFRPQLTHAGINCFDIDTMRKFYMDVIGLMESDQGLTTRLKQNVVFLSGDATKHHQIVLSTGRSPESKVSTVNQISFKVPSLDALREMFRRVNAAKCNRIFPVNHGNAWSVYFEDPEGNTIECYLDTPFYVAQPHTGVLDLATTDDEILEATREACKGDPYFMPVSEWQAKMAKGLANPAGLRLD